MVAHDRYRHSIRDRRDLQVTVGVYDRDVAVVLRSDREVILRQTHVVGINIRAFGLGFLAFLQSHVELAVRNRGLSSFRAVSIACNALLLASVHLAVMVAHDRYRHGIRIRRNL